MLSRIAAQGLTDALSAVALGACVLAAMRRGVRSPLELRLALAFGASALFFIFRSGAEILLRPELSTLTDVLACTLPVAALLLTEGLLRRHAPSALKVAITVGALGTGVALILSGARPPVSSWGLGGFILLSLLALSFLMVARDRSCLSHQENAVIDGLMLAGVGLTALSLTDFLPRAPIGMSGAGAAILALSTRANPTSPLGVQRALGELLLIGIAAALTAWGLGQAIPGIAPKETIRLGVVMLALMIALTTVISALRERHGRDEALTFRTALARADTTTLTNFLSGVAGQPVLKGLRVAEGALLQDYDAGVLVQAFDDRQLWTYQALSGAASPSAPGQDELTDLMARTESSHAALISQRPLRIALLTLPQMVSAQDPEVDLMLFCKLAALAAERGQ